VRFRKNSTTDLKDVDNPQMVVEIVRNSNSPSETEPMAHVSEINTARSRNSPDNELPVIQEDEESLSCLKKVEKFLTIFINPVFLKAFVLTFIAEWGDRSQISTVVLAVSTVG
jgi:putative Ca2+/H+ antiporter (TMEM165/GDT1 family)